MPPRIDGNHSSLSLPMPPRSHPSSFDSRSESEMSLSRPTSFVEDHSTHRVSMYRRREDSLENLANRPTEELCELVGKIRGMFRAPPTSDALSGKGTRRRGEFEMALG